MVKILRVLGLIAFAFGEPLQAMDLLETFKLALENDPKLKQAKDNQLAVNETKDQSIARFLPHLSSKGVAGHEWINNNNPRSILRTQEFWNNSLALNLNQPLFHWDHWIQLSQSDNQIAQAEAEYNAEFQELMVRTTEAYLNVLSAEEDYKYIVEEKEAIKQQLDQTREMFDSGMATITDVNEAEAGYEKAAADEIKAANKIDDQKEILRLIIGNNDIKLNGLLDNIAMTSPQPANVKDWSRIAETNNFKIIAAFNQMEVLRKGIDLQRNGHMPSLDMVGSYTLTDNQSNVGIQGDRQHIGVELNIPIYEGGEVNSKIRQANYQYLESKEKLDEVKRTINRQVSDSFRGIITSIREAEALDATVAATEKALRATEEGFREGIRTMVDILEVQKDLYQSKREFSRSRFDYFINSVKLKQAANNLSESDLELINKMLARSSSN